jgi:hypothetical protein
MSQPTHPHWAQMSAYGSFAYKALSASSMTMVPPFLRHPTNPGGEEETGHLTHKSDEAPKGGRYLAKPASHLCVSCVCVCVHVGGVGAMGS